MFGRDKEQGRKMEVVRGSVDPMTGKREGDYAVVFDPATGTARQVSIGSQLPPMDQNPAALAIKNGPGSDAEKRKQLQALGYT